jgi:hypothetical protein
MSKGSAVRRFENGQLDTDADFLYCRAWTTFDRYNQVWDLQKHRALDKFSRYVRENTDDSVLEDNGFVRIAPYQGDVEKNNIKKFMFSIENLAWNDKLENLLDCEKGPGDTLSGNRGRIMWFPPYEMSFNETTSVNWDKHLFIGRGEPMYTYNNTERTGTLQWKIIIDHPNYLNALKDKDNDYIASFMAGCMNGDDLDEANRIISQAEKDKIAVAGNSNTKNEDKTTGEEAPSPFTLYFKNDSSEIDELYENGLDKDGNPISYDLKNPTGDGDGLGTTQGDGTVGGAVFNYPDNTNFGLNNPGGLGWVDSSFIPALKSELNNNCPNCRIIIDGFASTQGNPDANSSTNSTNNVTLSEDRANAVKQWFLDNILEKNDPTLTNRFEINSIGERGVGCTGQNAQDRKSCKEARKAEVRFAYDAKLEDLRDQKRPPRVDPITSAARRQLNIPISRFFNECDYFEKLKQDDNVVYDKIRDKIKYFQPAFHSTTPEGFNSRLTFLQQCTRQGPTGGASETNSPDNLAFGRPPVCILRVGDFYHTKIIIDSLSFSFDPLVWDLNPEGVGVQPMICTVDMNFAFIGGSSLNGPISKLQNAVEFNYFANTRIYDRRADTIEVTGAEGVINEGIDSISPENTAQQSNIKEGIDNNTNNPEEIQTDVSENANSETEDAPPSDLEIIRDNTTILLAELSDNGRNVNVVLGVIEFEMNRDVEYIVYQEVDGVLVGIGFVTIEAEQGSGANNKMKLDQRVKDEEGATLIHVAVNLDSEEEKELSYPFIGRRVASRKE